jgi:Tol biopolymer transport system component
MYFSSSAAGNFHIWRQRYPDGRPEQVTSGPNEEEGFAMAPDGRSFITAVAQRRSMVFVHDAGGDRQISQEGYSFDPKFSPDGKQLFYRILKGGLSNYDPSELRVVELATGHNDPVFPGVSISGPPGRVYEISPDGRQVVTAARDADGKARLWLAAVDRQSPPRMIPGVQGEFPVFGKNGEIIFRTVEGSIAHAYGAQPDGSQLRRLSEQPVVLPAGISPNGAWVVMRVTKEGGEAVMAFPSSGGAPRTIFKRTSSYHLAWSPDGKLIFISVPTSATASHFIGKTYVVPLPPGQVFPPMPEEGLSNGAELAMRPGVRIIDAFDAAPGPSPEVYAYSRAGVQRNLYRIPVP